MSAYLTEQEVDFILETTKKAKEVILQLDADIRMLGRMGANICPVCIHYNKGAGSPEHCPRFLKEDCFEWRGVQNG